MSAEPKKSTNTENDLSVYMMALQQVQKSLGELSTKIGGIEDTLGWTGHDEHGDLIGKGIAGNLARLEARVDRRFRIYDGVTRYAAGATATAVLMSAILWFVIKNKLEAFFQ